MNKITSNIIKGVAGRLQRKKKAHGMSELTWLQEKILKHQEDETVKQHRFKNFTVLYKRPYELLHTYRELFENELYKFQTKSNAPVIIDCGANIGLSVLYFKQLYPQALVDAYEPDEQNFDILSRNCNANGLQTVYLHKAAVWIKNGTISFEATESEASHVSEQDHANVVQVPSVRLANALQKYPRIDFLKIDIEGAEWQVVQDIATELHRVENFFLEYHGKAAETYKLNDIMGILKSSGFSVYIKNAADNLTHPFVEKTTGTLYDVQLNIFCYRN
jgi:FkbM family methyltransferase